MFSHVNFVNDEIERQENLEKIRQKKCDNHNKYQVSHFCTNPSCVQNSTSFLCELCYNNHSKNHLIHKKIKTVDELFSTKRLAQMKEYSKIHLAYEDKIDQVLQDLDHKFRKLKKVFVKSLKMSAKKQKITLKKIFSREKQ